MTPDSFSDGGVHCDAKRAIDHGLQLLEDGADVLDIGGESTRPGAEPVAAGEQLTRVLPVVRGLREATDAPLSIDTRLPEVACEALAAGVDVINDVAACQAPGWDRVVTEWEVPIILMHMLGEPRTMQKNPHYPDGVTVAVREFFRSRLDALRDWGVESSRVILDPGIGFGKLLQHNLELIRNIEEVRSCDLPVLVGLSRKGFIGSILDRDVGDRDIGTMMANAAAIYAGADVLRVHNAALTRDLVAMVAAIGPLASPVEG